MRKILTMTFAALVAVALASPAHAADGKQALVEGTQLVHKGKRVRGALGLVRPAGRAAVGVGRAAVAVGKAAKPLRRAGWFARAMGRGAGRAARAAGRAAVGAAKVATPFRLFKKRFVAPVEP
jgi:hypothetical protein